MAACEERDTREQWYSGSFLVSVVECLDAAGETCRDTDGEYWEYRIAIPENELTAEFLRRIRDKAAPNQALRQCHNWGYEFYDEAGQNYTEFEFNLTIPESENREQMIRNHISQSIAEIHTHQDALARWILEA